MARAIGDRKSLAVINGDLHWNVIKLRNDAPHSFGVWGRGPGRAAGGGYILRKIRCLSSLHGKKGHKTVA
ncbi:uncharacterized protein PADG_11245 [Paracoccidioides brasiliensis Pb18]|uniref:Uncharacterized protein n=1 Tax=Paracoccidioides brasiliensis (strain Pb18) TaxID=502780 RepID=A0A0A0HT92_PARBD|nr:uncharacterized protein PADG_11245 [Paracoccidioides brasiliensis Pb18]KGM92429.1 hypothetical protein PADG_11245 [Paracoccidioides brasiliensis Pb18]ODH51342.1 hypothetical protein GX48_02582 [Paracoccidioides brasiliensis]